MYHHKYKTNSFGYSACPLNLKLFAQMHNDDRLKGTTLEGYAFSKASIYFKNLLEFTNKNNPGLLDSKYISELTEDLNILSFLDEKYNVVISNYREPYDYRSVNILEQEIDKAIMGVTEEVVNILNNTRKVLMPGGWAGDPGHAMCYKFIKQPDGSYLFIIYNTGEGINYHKTKETAKIEYLPVSTFLIPGCCPEEALKIFMQQLIIPCIKPLLTYIKQNYGKKVEHTYDGNKLYTKIINKVFYLKGIHIDPEYYYQYYTQGQISGTCVASVLALFIRTIFKPEEQQQFEILFHEIKGQTIYDFYHTCKLNDCLSEQKNKSQLMIAVAKFAYSSNLLWEKNYINEEQKNKYLNLINEVSFCLQGKEKSLSAVMETFLPSEKVFVGNNINSEQENFMLTEESLESPKNIEFNKKPNNYGQPFLVKGNIAYVPDRHQYVNIIDYLEIYIAACSFNEKNKHVHLVINDIGNLFLSVPLEENDFKEYFLNLNTSVDIQDCLSKIYKLMQIYAKNCVLQGGHVLPKQVLIGYISVIVCNQLGKLYFKDLIEDYYPFHKIYNDNYVSIGLSQPDLLVDINDRYNTESSYITGGSCVHHSPIDTTLDPLYDKKINQIIKALDLIAQNLILAKKNIII